MLISSKLKELDKIVDRLEAQQTSSDLYEHLKHDLSHISSELNIKIQKLENSLHTRLSDETKEYQDITHKWLHNTAHDIQKQLQARLDSNTKDFFDILSAELTKNIDKEVAEEIASLHEKVDINIIIENIKNDESIIYRIINNSTQAIKDSIDLDSIQRVLKEELKTEIDLNDIIKAALETNIITDEIREKINEKITEIINTHINADETKAALNLALQSLQDDFSTYIEQEKLKGNEVALKALQDFNIALQNLKSQASNQIDLIKEDLEGVKDEATTHIDTKKDETIEGFNLAKEEVARAKSVAIENFKEAMKEVLAIFETYLLENKQEALNDIINLVSQNIINNQSEIIKDEVVLRGFEYLKQYDLMLREEVIQRVLNHFLEVNSNEEIRHFILNDIHIQERIANEARIVAESKLSHAALKGFVKEALKESAKEILKNDELLRAEAEAQAHLVAIRLQSSLSTMQEILDNLTLEFELDSKIELLAEKERLFNIALQEAKDELKDEFKGAIVSDTIQRYIDDTFIRYDADQDAQTDSKISDLRVDIESKISDLDSKLSQDDLNISNAIASMEGLINALQNAADELKLRIETLEANAPTIPQNPNPIIPPQMQGNNKYLVFS